MSASACGRPVSPLDRVPRVTLEITSVPEPDPRLRTVAGQLVASANADAPDPELVLVRTLFGLCTLGRLVASDATSATFRVVAPRGELDLAVVVDQGTGELLTATWTPCPVRLPVFEVR